jgi:hypothetical protein
LRWGRKRRNILLSQVARQMKVYEEKLKSLGESIHVHWFDAGYGSLSQEEQIKQHELMLRFAHQVLG